VGDELFHVDRRTDRNMTKLTVAFLKYFTMKHKRKERKQDANKGKGNNK